MDNVIIELECKRCGNKWFPKRPKLPKVCPSCNSRKWNVKREETWKKKNH